MSCNAYCAGLMELWLMPLPMLFPIELPIEFGAMLVLVVVVVVVVLCMLLVPFPMLSWLMPDGPDIELPMELPIGVLL